MSEIKHPENNEHQPMPVPKSDPNSLGLPERKGTGKKVWLVIITALITAVICIGGTWYYMNKKAENTKNDLQNQINQLNQLLSEKQSTSSGSNNTDTTNYTTKFEKLNFNYSDSLKMTDTSKPNGPNGEVGRDEITLSNGLFKGTIQTGLYGVGGACAPTCKVLLSEPITVLGKQRYLNYVSVDGGPKADYVVVTDKPTDFYGYLEGKNILVDGKPTLMVFQASYLNGDKQIGKTVAELQADANIVAYKQTLQSMKY
jgi:hypothetical protein